MVIEVVIGIVLNSCSNGSIQIRFIFCDKICFFANALVIGFIVPEFTERKNSKVRLFINRANIHVLV